MHTIYDWLTVVIFAGIVTLFLQRSVGTPPPGDRLINYFPPAVGCAFANYCGNEGYHLIAIALILTVLAYIVLILKPFPIGR